METVTKKTISDLTIESVSILTQQFEVVKEVQTIEEDGESKEIEVEKETQIGSNHRCAYSNSESGRALLIENEPEDIVAEIMEVWGDAPTVEEYKDIVIEPTAEERIRELEAQNADSVEIEADLMYELALIQLGLI